MRVPDTRRRSSAVLLAAALLLPLPAPLGAQSAADGELIESQRRLDQIRREREALRDEMTRIRSRVTDLSGELSNLDRQVGTSSGLLQELEYQVSQREALIERNTYELLVTRDRLAEQRAVLHRRLRDIYKRGPLPTLQVLLAADSFSDLLNRYRYLHRIARYDRRLTEEVATLERQLVLRERALRTNLNQLATVRAEHSDEHALLALLQQEQNRALLEARSRQSTTDQRFAELARDEAGLGDLLADLERRRRTATGRVGAPREPPTASLGPSRRGTLDWPVEGRLLYGFGRVVQPDGLPVRWTGIGIGAPAGAPVAAVESGLVVVSGPFQSYGPTVVLSHGGGYYTLYLYLQELHVREGEMVERGRTVGTVGGPTAGEGPHIEFQVRLPSGEADDPLLWLRAR